MADNTDNDNRKLSRPSKRLVYASLLHEIELCCSIGNKKVVQGKHSQESATHT